jgi:hypothetical protein
MRRLDLTNHRFGKLTARWPAGRSCTRILWLCSCDCGKLSVVFALNLTRNHSSSCGCEGSRTTLKDRLTKHGMTGTPTYKTWLCMIYRCTKPAHEHYKYYGGRGVSVCDRWRTFSNFYADMGKRPIGMTLDRINNEGNYEPSNCRWATKKEQMANSRPKQRKYIGPQLKNRGFFSWHERRNRP